MERLTEKTITDAVKQHGGVLAGWYHLSSQGYLPGEIAAWSPAKMPGDVAYQVRQYAERHKLPVPATCAPKLQRKVAKITTDWKVLFRSSIMKTGFALVLTHPMLEYLCAVADNVHWDRSRNFQLTGNAMPDNFIATSNALLKRGLIQPRTHKKNPWEPNYDLTPAGLRIVELLKLAGEFKVADEALEQNS